MSKGVVVLIKKDDKFLFIEEKRDLMLGCWAPPHGRMEENESEPEAVIREVKEEVGLDVEPIKKITETKADTKVKTVEWWEARIKGDAKINIDEEEVADFGWFSVREALELKLYPGTKLFLEKFGDKL